MINLSCSIVTYNNDPEVLKKTINSFFTAGIPSRQLYIIDNSTRNNIYDHIQQYNGSIKYIRNKKNIGFGKAHNIAIQDIFHHNGGARYHLILNPDVWFNGKTLLNMIDYMDKHHSIGMMSPKVLYPDGSFQYVHRRLPAPRDSLVRMFHKILPQKFVNKINTRYEMQNMNENNIQQIPH
ncbi:MAG TPA: glycosyltransferase, partial [Spirochaetota bacterium]|nr:glycosyltransferase [Spirochaetota bacterium]